MTSTKNLTATRGVPFRFAVYLVGIDVTTYTARMQIRVNNAIPSAGTLALELSVGSGIVVTGSTTVPSPDGRVAGLFMVTITATQMAALADDVYNWGFETTDGAAEPELVFRGKFAVGDNVVHS